jgi:hypothetical protein
MTLLLALVLVLIQTALAVNDFKQVEFHLPNEECDNYNGFDSCKSGSDVSYGDETDARMWQTPKRNSANYAESFHDYSDLQAYAKVSYSNDKNSAVLLVKSFTKSPSKVQCRLEGFEWQDSCEFKFTAERFMQAYSKASDAQRLKMELDGVVVSVRSEVANLTLDPVFFLWQNPTINAEMSENGQRFEIA